jgi:MYXO-CTERM domain-containing protein
MVIRHDVVDSEYVVADAEYPALVDLFDPGDCIGTLIHESFLLTVAHCAEDLVAGESLEVNGASHVIADVVLHPNWQDFEYDIALVRFETPVTTAKPLPIYRGSDELGSVITLVGRGVTASGLQGEDGAVSDGKLRRATNVVSAVNDHFLQITFERDGEQGLTDLEGVGAAGDSGCPGFVEVDKKRYIAGLNSYGDAPNGIGIAQYGSWDYQTRVSSYLDWLDSVVDTTPDQPDAEPDSDDPPDGDPDPDPPDGDPGDPDAGDTGSDDPGSGELDPDDGRTDGGGCSAAGPPPKGRFALGLLLAVVGARRTRREHRRQGTKRTRCASPSPA